LQINIYREDTGKSKQGRRGYERGDDKMGHHPIIIGYCESDEWRIDKKNSERI
jgi:hypothetical protein